MPPFVFAQSLPGGIRRDEGLLHAERSRGIPGPAGASRQYTPKTPQSKDQFPKLNAGVQLDVPVDQIEKCSQDYIKIVLYIFLPTSISVVSNIKLSLD